MKESMKQFWTLLSIKNTPMSLFTTAGQNVKYRLVKAFCLSLYACQLLDLTSQDLGKLLTSLRKCLRKLLVLAATARGDLVPFSM